MYRVAAIGGDGIGPEIIREGKKVLDTAGERFGCDIAWEDFDIGAERYLKTGELITEGELKDLSHYRAIYFGAIGDERVIPGIHEKGIRVAITKCCLRRFRPYFRENRALRPWTWIWGCGFSCSGQ